MTDWIDHDGGPQPVAYDTWIEVEGNPVAPDSGLACGFEWHNPCRYRILNQHLIDAARLEGIRLGLEAAAKEVGARRWRWSTWENHPRMSQWAKSVQSAYEHCEFLIRALNPDTIARDVQTVSHQEKCDSLHIAREAQDMASEKEAKDD